MGSVKKLFQGIVKVKKIVDEADGVKSFYFSIDDFEYEPGHFVMIALPEEAEDKKKRRAYSIATSPTETKKDGLIGITIKLVEGGYLTTRVHDSSVIYEGADLFVAGPFGHPIFSNPQTTKSVALFAAGSGVVPVRSAMKYIYDSMPNTKVTLFYSFRTPRDFIYENDMKEMLKSPNFKGFITVTRYDGDDWKGLRGRITRDLILDNITGEEDVFYACGNTPFVKEIENIIINELKVDKSKFKSEAWG
ncbi:MAG: FAD-binding oxidoreductase [Spirochaetia bacterium]|nr:FAD-binding oxidoreductase [Spirochaetota bacterium]MCX8096874.1 FAD-binding oxidoreductase [Spirochaetota bacterium]MDW8112991.1 FAD-binding oxidoreductase [Spirochaetia bacterium]